LTDRHLLLIIIAMLLGTLVASLDYLARNTTDVVRLLFDFSFTFGLVWLGYTLGRHD